MRADSDHDDHQLCAVRGESYRHALENVVDEQTNREDDRSRPRVVALSGIGLVGLVHTLNRVFAFSHTHDEGLPLVEHVGDLLVLLLLLETLEHHGVLEDGFGHDFVLGLLVQVVHVGEGAQQAFVHFLD